MIERKQVKSMELRVLRYFLTVAREQNITRAANMLHITQPTLSRQLMQLEQELGVALLERGAGQITLTKEGMLLRRRGEELLELADRTEKELMDQSAELSGEIYIGSGETDLFHELSTAMKSFRELHPQVTYHIYSGTADDINEKISNGLIDLALLVEPVDIERFEFIRMPKRERSGILLRTDDPLAQLEWITPEDLIGKSMIMPKRGIVQHEIEHWLKDVADQVHVVATINLIHNAKIMVADGIGYAYALEHLVEEQEESSICFRPFYPTMETGCILVWKKHQIFSDAATAFLNQLKHAFKA